MTLRASCRRHAGAFLFAGAFLCVLGCRLTVIHRYGTDLPYMDQWGKEADFVLTPLREGRPEWLQGALLPHNEHRIYFTLGVDVLLTQLSGQWDARQECVINALLHAAIAASLALFVRRRLPGAWGIVGTGLVIVLAATPLAWDNVLWGFQSQFAFLIGFSLLGMDGLLREKFSARWFLGLLAMLCALVSMGSGFFCAAPVLLLLLRDILVNRRTWRASLPSLIAATGILALGWHFHFEPPWHVGLRASNAGEFFTYAAHCLAWPLPKHIFFGAVYYSPLLLLGARWLARGTPATEAAHAMRFTLAAGGWVLLHIAAFAYARGVGGGFPANRYGDIFAVGIIANALALGLLAPKGAKAGWLLWATAWLAVLVLDGGEALKKSYREDLPRHRSEVRTLEASVRAYVADGDAVALRGRPIPFTDYDWFLRVLDRPSIRAVLPPSVSSPHRVSALSFFARRLSKWGWVLTALGVTLLVVNIKRDSRLRQKRAGY